MLERREARLRLVEMLRGRRMNPCPVFPVDGRAFTRPRMTTQSGGYDEAWPSIVPVSTCVIFSCGGTGFCASENDNSIRRPRRSVALHRTCKLPASFFPVEGRAFARPRMTTQSGGHDEAWPSIVPVCTCVIFSRGGTRFRASA